MENEIILTPMQVNYLNYDLEKIELDLKKAMIAIKEYKDMTMSVGLKRGEVVDDEYYRDIARLVAERDEKQQYLSSYTLAKPTGNCVQIGSVVELIPFGKEVMVVHKSVTSNPVMTEVSIDSPIFGAIFMHKPGDICEYAVNGKVYKCVIGKVDNDFCNSFDFSMESESFVKVR